MCVNRQERDHFHTDKNTKRALLVGGRRQKMLLQGQAWKPKLRLAAGAWNLRAIVDAPSSKLKEGRRGDPNLVFNF